MSQHEIEIYLEISFANTEKEQFDDKKINEIIDFLEFNELEVLKDQLIEVNYRDFAGKLKEFRNYKLVVSSSMVGIDYDLGKDTMRIINSYDSGKYNIRAINLNFLEV